MKFGKGKKVKFSKQPQIRNMTQEDIDRGLEEMFKGQKKVETVERRENIKRAGAPRLTFEPEPEPEPEPEEDEAYWNGGEWEQWAYEMYKNYPDSRKFLPDWFLQALKEAMNK